MSQTIRLQSESLPPIETFSAGSQIAETNTQPAKLFRFEARADSLFERDGDSIDDFIAELSQDAAFENELRAARHRRAFDLEAREGKTLKVLRLSRGMSQAELAVRIGMKQPHIARIERGHNCPTWQTCRRLAEALGVDLNTLDEYLPTVADTVEGEE